MIPQWIRTVLLIAVDLLVISLVLVLGFLIRFDFSIPSTYLDLQVALKIWLVTIIAKIGVFYYFGLYKRIWRYASLEELKAILMSTTLGSGLIGTFFWLDDTVVYPRSILLINWALTVLGIGAVRFSWRLYRESFLSSRQKGPVKRVLVVGAGDAGELVIRGLKKHQELRYKIIGVVDDDPLKQKMELHGHRVLGQRENLKDIIRNYQVEEVIIAIPSAPGQIIREINNICIEEGVEARILPGVYEILSGDVSVSQLREVRMEDLLRREPIQLDQEGISHYLHTKTVLITGGGGSIGSELARQIAGFKPARVIILDISENNVYRISMEMQEAFPDLDVVSIVGSIQDKPRIERIFREYTPQVIFHAAAYKHVPLMEDNATEAIKNNVFGTINLVDAAHEHKAQRFVLISTDKAVNPTNIMGATKRIAEIVIQARNRVSETEFVAVRFGNVLESEGSAIPLFKEQIQRGGPVTITHKDISRYFMTIPEAVQLVMQAGAMAAGGEIFILDMGEPIKILDLAEDLIRLSGYEPDVDIPIKFIGLRQGEKMKEELIMDEEEVEKTTHEKIFISKPVYIDYKELDNELQELQEIIFKDSQEMREKLKKIIPQFQFIRRTVV